MRRVFVASFGTAWGTIRTAATEGGLVIIALPGQSRKYFDSQVTACADGSEIVAAGPINVRAERQLREYLAGRRREFNLKLKLTGTPFQQEVWREVRAVPYGETRTYGQIARAIGRPRAFRAVGAANGQNRLPLVIPCHRVVAASGLGGYGGGPGLKRKLLQLEGAL